jgi:hypothetical protein
MTVGLDTDMFPAYIRLNGVNAKEHPVFKELSRVKLYFEKIKLAEAGEQKRQNLTLDKAAALRVVKHALVCRTHRECVDGANLGKSVNGSIGQSKGLQAAVGKHAAPSNPEAPSKKRKVAKS